MTDADLKRDRDLSEVAAGRTQTPRAAAAERPGRWTPAQAIYRDQCSACHALDGKGVAELFPSLAQSVAGAVERSDQR